MRDFIDKEKSLKSLVELSALCPYTRLKIKKGNKMKLEKLTWTNDLRAALVAIGYDEDGHDPLRGYFNDKHLTCRRIKLTVHQYVTDENLALMQQAIQARRPNLNVTVSRWESRVGWQGFGNVVVYYRPKTGLYMDHKVA